MFSNGVISVDSYKIGPLFIDIQNAGVRIDYNNSMYLFENKFRQLAVKCQGITPKR